MWSHDHAYELEVSNLLGDEVQRGPELGLVQGYTEGSCGGSASGEFSVRKYCISPLISRL